MEIFRPVNGVYQSLNNPANKNGYVLREKTGYYPVLIPIEAANHDETARELTERYPIYEVSGRTPLNSVTRRRIIYL